MKIARFRIDDRVAYGAVRGNQVEELRGSIYGRYRLTGIKHQLKQVRFLPPTDPVQIWCPGPNFADHLATARALGALKGTLKEPRPWTKGLNALIGHEDAIVIPRSSKGDVHYEGELVAVISRTCRNIAAEEVYKYLLGYTCGNDVSERTWQKNDSSLWRAKGCDTFCPVGPWIETELDSSCVDMVVRLNSKEVQRANTKHMLFSFPTLISYISKYVSLYPGDLVFSGTAGETRAMKSGDVVEVEIEGIGVLRNHVKAEERLLQKA